MNNSNGRAAFSTVNSASLPAKIAGILRGSITGGRLKPAGQVVESRLAKQMGVGQNAVREALHELEFQGYVRKVAHVGTFVTKLSRRDVDEIFRMRMELEPLAVYWARERDRPNDDDLARMGKHLDNCATAARAGDFAAYALADTEFHRALWRMAGNSYLEKCLERTAVPVLCGALLQCDGPLKLDLDALVSQHREWIEVLRTKPPRLAYIYTRNLISSFWGQLEGATSGGQQSQAEVAEEPSTAVVGQG